MVTSYKWLTELVTSRQTMIVPGSEKKITLSLVFITNRPVSFVRSNSGGWLVGYFLATVEEGIVQLGKRKLSKNSLRC